MELVRQDGVTVSFVLDGRGRPGVAREFQLRFFISLNTLNYHQWKLPQLQYSSGLPFILHLP
jgi:hypothetical protein